MASHFESWQRLPNQTLMAKEQLFLCADGQAAHEERPRCGGEAADAGGAPRGGGQDRAGECALPAGGHHNEESLCMSSAQGGTPAFLWDCLATSTNMYQAAHDRFLMSPMCYAAAAGAGGGGQKAQRREEHQVLGPHRALPLQVHQQGQGAGRAFGLAPSGAVWRIRQLYA